MKLTFRRANASSRFRPLLAVVALTGLASLPGQASTLGAKRVIMCSLLSERTVRQYSILSAANLEAAGDVPERCRVLAVLPPEIVFEVVLPMEWNGRIVLRGNGGYGGNSLDDPGSVPVSEPAVTDGFVSVYSNTGLDRAAEPVGTFGFNNRKKEIDHSFRGVRVTIQTAKELVGMYFCQPLSYPYWRGCSMVSRAPMVFL